MNLKLEIYNYKSIVNETIEIDKSINYIIGPNESGKSNFLEAINDITKEKLDLNLKNFNFRDSDFKIDFSWNVSKNIIKKWQKLGFKFNNILISREINDTSNLYFVDSDENLSKFIFNKLKNFYSIPVALEGDMLDVDLIKELTLLKEDSLDIRNQILVLLNETLDLTNSIEIYFFNDFKLLQREYIFDDAISSPTFLGLWELLGQKEDSLKNLKELSKNPNSDEFINKQNEISNNLSIEFKNFISSFWGQNTINFAITFKDNGFIIRAADIFDEDKIGEYKNIDYRSNGMKHYLSIVLFLNYLINRMDIEKQVIILFDEPDIYLHANAVIDLRKYIEKLSNEHKNLKFLISTHNPFFINEDNFKDISFIAKNSKDSGSIIRRKQLRKNIQDSHSTLEPFLYSIGIDKKSLISLKDSINIFVEGFHDMYILNSIKYILAKENKSYNKLNFIPLGSATKFDSPLINIVFSLSHKMPYFILDYDDAGNKFIQKNIDKWIFLDLNNFSFINCKYKYNPNDEKVETHNLLGLNKKTNEIIEFCNSLKEGKISLKPEQKLNFKNIFDKIIK